jgi:hypothetical protein
MPFAFFVKQVEVGASLAATIKELNASAEEVLSIVYQPQVGGGRRGEGE